MATTNGAHVGTCGRNGVFEDLEPSNLGGFQFKLIPDPLQNWLGSPPPRSISGIVRVHVSPITCNWDINPSCICISICLDIHARVYIILNVQIYIYISIYLSIYLSVYLSIYLSIYHDIPILRKLYIYIHTSDYVYIKYIHITSQLPNAVHIYVGYIGFNI